jgi:hypothetical protein
MGSDYTLFPRNKIRVAPVYPTVQYCGYPRTVWATTRRAGSWGNLDVYHHLGEGAERVTKMRTGKRFDALREHIKNKLGDREFAPTHRFLKELASEVDDWEEEFLDAARTIGAETFRPGLEDATPLWDDCADIYGQGRSFRSEVADKIAEWFDGNVDLHETFDRRLQAAWMKHVLSPLRELCEGSIEGPDITPLEVDSPATTTSSESRPLA